MEKIESFKNLAFDLIKPIGIYNIFDSHYLKPDYLFGKSIKTVLAACTIGTCIDSKINELMNNNSLSNAVILDSIASLTAEEVTSSLNNILKEEIQEIYPKYKITKRFSPGYCNWPLSGQKMIFDLININKINIILNDSMMMIPRKSVTFAINIGVNIDETLGNRECDTCNLVNCKFRRI